MDEKTKERVNAIAKSLKELHLAATMEEALKRAREIVASAQDNGKPIRELMNEIKEEASEQSKEAGHIEKSSETARKELDSEAHEEHRDAEHAVESARQSKAAAKSAKEEVNYDIKVHKLEKSDVKDAMHEVDELECAAEDADYIIKEAEKIQKSKPKKK